MKIYYDEKRDLLYLRFEEGKHQVVNKRVTDDVVLDIEGEKIIGMEVLEASKHLSLSEILPIDYEVQSKAPMEGAA